MRHWLGFAIKSAQLLVLALVVLATAQLSRAAAPCCAVTAVNQKTGLVTASVKATGQTFTFKAGASVLRGLHVGSAVYANFKTKQVSVNGEAPCCNIVSVAAGAAKVASASSNPLAPCCAVMAMDDKTGQVTIKQNSTGQLITLRPLEPPNGLRLSAIFKIGGQVGFEPVDSGVLRAGSSLKLSVPGFDPVDGVVSHISAH